MNDRQKLGYELCLIHLLFQHWEYRRRINRIAQCCSVLTRQGILRRVKRGTYEIVKPEKLKT